MTDSLPLYKPLPAGWVVFHKWNDQTIDGAGKTQVEAWNDFTTNMERAGIHVLDEHTCAKDRFDVPVLRPYAMIDNYTVKPASQALLDKIAKCGGNIAWGRIGETRVTLDELETYLAAEERDEGDNDYSRNDE